MKDPPWKHPSLSKNDPMTLKDKAPIPGGLFSVKGFFVIKIQLAAPSAKGFVCSLGGLLFQAKPFYINQTDVSKGKIVGQNQNYVTLK